jgi:hypothetical protein
VPNLQQNSYMNFANENLFLSHFGYKTNRPTIWCFCWFERKIVNNVSYNIRGSYKRKEIGHCLEVMIIVKIGQTKIMPTELFSSRLWWYETVSFSGDLKANFSGCDFWISGTFSSYTNDVEQEAWNLPTIKLNSSIDFNITPKWFAVHCFFYVGERKDFKMNSDIIYIVALAKSNNLEIIFWC